ncbi:hypothetical protein BDZ89DRAFT_741424 [Hymenopellis radicata]|nr:hypothetical protein BDZ89DRAFT_741424 [Hymenopellis radicata]
MTPGGEKQGGVDCSMCLASDVSSSRNSSNTRCLSCPFYAYLDSGSSAAKHWWSPRRQLFFAGTWVVNIYDQITAFSDTRNSPYPALHNKWTVSIRPRYPWVDSIFQRGGVLLSLFRTMDGIMPAFHLELYIMVVQPSISYHRHHHSHCAFLLVSPQP